jgi:hypothetical protein
MEKKPGRPRFRETRGDSASAQRYRALNEEEKQARRALTQKRIKEYQQQSLEHADRDHLEWTEDDDLEVLFGEGRDVDIAIRLGRTFHNVHHRRSKLVEWLREDDTIAYPESTTTRPNKVAPTLCPCGASDGDHEKWCPEKQ